MGEEGKLSTVALLEAALFIAQEPLSLEQLSEVCQASVQEVKNALEKLGNALKESDRGLILLDEPEGCLLGTKPQSAIYLEKFFYGEQPATPLSQAALETLAIIAFKQPVTKIEIETIRGVKVDGVLENLARRRLIEVAGRKEVMGRPLLYITTAEFLQYFGLRNIEELEDKSGESDIDFSGKGEAK